MIVVATETFALYQELIAELRDRDATFTTVEPGEDLPEETAVVLTDVETPAWAPADTSVVTADPDDPRAAVDAALAALHREGGPTVVGVDPGDRPGIAVLEGQEVVAAFQVPEADAAEVVLGEIADQPDAVVRVGDGARLVGARLVEELEDATVELVDERATTPHLGTGARGMGDVLAAVNIARREGEPIDSRDVEPTDGELSEIQARSRESGHTDREIDADLARRVASGELTLAEALSAHREDGPD